MSNSTASSVFIGRTNEVELLKKSFQPVGIPHRGILFIVGPTGIGKTAISQKVLSEIKREMI